MQLLKDSEYPWFSLQFSQFPMMFPHHSNSHSSGEVKVSGHPQTNHLFTPRSSTADVGELPAPGGPALQVSVWALQHPASRGHCKESDCNPAPEPILLEESPVKTGSVAQPKPALPGLPFPGKTLPGLPIWQYQLYNPSPKTMQPKQSPETASVVSLAV